MKRARILLVSVASLGLSTFAGTGLAQNSSSTAQQQRQLPQRSSGSTSSSSSSSSGDTRQPIPGDTRRSIPGDTRVNTGQPESTPAQQGRPDRPTTPGRDDPARPGDPSRDRSHRGEDSDRGRDGDDDHPHRRPYPTPGYYRPPYYGGGYYPPGYYEPPYEPYRDRRAVGDEPMAGEDGGGGGGGGAADRTPPPGTPRLPPDELLGDHDVSPALRRALDASAQYREATAQLINSWTAYAEAAEKVLSSTHKTAAYRRALADLDRAEAGLAAVKNSAQADRLVNAARAVIDARHVLRDQEEAALAGDPNLQRLKKQVDQIVERRNRIRADIASRLPGERKAE